MPSIRDREKPLGFPFSAQRHERVGGIDILVNNASAISMTDTEHTPMKRYDLINGINARGTYLCTLACLI